jgi:hypothetical protein
VIYINKKREAAGKGIKRDLGGKGEEADRRRREREAVI